MFVTREMALWGFLRVSPLEEHPFCGGYPSLLGACSCHPCNLLSSF